MLHATCSCMELWVDMTVRNGNNNKWARPSWDSRLYVSKAAAWIRTVGRANVQLGFSISITMEDNDDYYAMYWECTCSVAVLYKYQYRNGAGPKALMWLQTPPKPHPSNYINGT